MPDLFLIGESNELAYSSSSSKVMRQPEPSMRMSWPIFRRCVARFTPTMAGMPYSRAVTTAPWVIMRPVSITSPAAVKKSGVHERSVPGQTMISPDCSRALRGSSTTRTRPCTLPGETGLPKNTPFTGFLFNEYLFSLLAIV